MGEQRRGVAHLSQFTSAFRTGIDVRAHYLRVAPVKRVNRCQRQKLLILGVFHQTKPRERSRNNSRNLLNPERIRVFTVPSGSPKRSAISVCVRPSK